MRAPISDWVEPESDRAVAAFTLAGTGGNPDPYMNPQTILVFDDHLGSSHTAWIDTTNAVIRLRYFPWGKERGSTGAWPSDRRFTGQISDDTAAASGDIDLLFYNARYDDPATGGFVAADTIVPDPSHPADLNRYAYVRNNPINHTDPSGNVLDLQPRIAGDYDQWEHQETLTRQWHDQHGTPGGSDSSLGGGLFRFFVFDDRQCTGGGSGTGCGIEVAGILPLGRILKPLGKFARLFRRANSVADEASDVARHAGRRATTGIAGTTARNADELLQSGREVTGRFPRTAGSNEVLLRRAPDGSLTHYQVYDANGLPVMRVDLAGRPHGGIPTPHVTDFRHSVNPATGEVFLAPGPARPALPNEIPTP